MDYFEPGLRELSRIAGRQILRLRRSIARRRLAKAEATLGLLGWQQADFDSETQEHVREIVGFEREQGRLMNESATVGRVMNDLIAERDAARLKFEEKRRALEAERAHIVAKHPDIEAQLAEMRRRAPTFESRMPELDRELRDVQKRYSELLTRDPQTASDRQEMIRLRDRTVSIPNEKSDLRTQHMRTVSAIHTLEAQLTTEREAADAVTKRIRALEREFDAADGGLAGRIHELEKQRESVAKEIDALEARKEAPYRQVGRVLADSHVAPVNQPHALEDVRTLRSAIQELEYEIASSLAETGREDAKELRASLIVWGGFFLLLLLLIILLALPWVVR